MGKERVETKTESTQQAEPHPLQVESMDLDVDRKKAAQEGILRLDQLGMDAVSRLLAGEELPGNLGVLSGGITDDMADELAYDAVEGLKPQFQGAGIFDSGTTASAAARTSGDIRRNVAEFNLGNLLNLLNLGVGGQAQIQAPISASASRLSQSLAGLRTVNTSGTSNQNTSTNFWASPAGAGFMSGFGQGLGGGLFPD